MCLLTVLTQTFAEMHSQTERTHLPHRVKQRRRVHCFSAGISAFAVDFFILLLQRASYWIQLQVYKTLLLYYLFITIDQNTYSQSVYLSREAHWIPCWVMLFFSLSLCFVKQARLSYTFSLVQTVWIVCVCACAMLVRERVSTILG